MISRSSIEVVKSMNIKKVVKNEEWQNIRKSFLGTWMKQPEENVEVLRTYLGDFSCPMKLRRVLNYITGTGFRSGKIQHPSISLLHDEILKIWRYE